MELLAQVTSRRFTAAIVLRDDIVTETAPILRFMKRWSRDRVRDYCQRNRWTIELVEP